MRTHTYTDVHAHILSHEHTHTHTQTHILLTFIVSVPLYCSTFIQSGGTAPRPYKIKPMYVVVLSISQLLASYKKVLKLKVFWMPLILKHKIFQGFINT